MSDEQSTSAPEEWRDLTPEATGHPIPPGYQISSLGRLRTRRLSYGRTSPDWQIIKGSRLSSGYIQYRFRQVGKPRLQLSAHRLVAMVFIGPPPFKDAEVRHWDGNPQNNAASNLLWGTSQDNADDKERLGELRGEQVGTAVLTAELALEAVRLSGEGLSRQAIADRLGVTQVNVSHILLGRTWSAVTGIAPRPLGPSRLILDADGARDVVRLRREGWERQAIADHKGISLSAVKQILAGRSWSEATGIQKKERKPKGR